MAAIKIPHNKYRDAIDQVIAYNSKILLDRRLRYPYIDGQTGVAQQDCHLWVSRVARSAPTRPGQICSYPSRRWRVRKRPDFDKLSRSKVKQETPGKAKISTSTVETSELGRYHGNIFLVTYMHLHIKFSVISTMCLFISLNERKVSSSIAEAFLRGG